MDHSQVPRDVCIAGRGLVLSGSYRPQPGTKRCLYSGRGLVLSGPYRPQPGTKRCLYSGQGLLLSGPIDHSQVPSTVCIPAGDWC